MTFRTNCGNKLILLSFLIKSLLPETVFPQERTANIADQFSKIVPSQKTGDQESSFPSGSILVVANQKLQKLIMRQELDLKLLMEHTSSL
jgi:hypothetical protein